MDTLKRFTNNLCGDFNNDKQIQDQEAKGKVTHPKAKHINRIANDKIINLPCDFNGYFIIEESYYEIGNRKNILPHLFLFINRIAIRQFFYNLHGCFFICIHVFYKQ